MRFAATLLVTLVLAGCGATMPHYVPTPDIPDGARAGIKDSVALGDFTVKSGNPNAQFVQLRAVKLEPTVGDYAAYLKLGVRTELERARKYKQDAPLVLHGELVKNEVDASGIRVGTANLAANFRMTRGGQPVFEKPYTVKSEWESSFVGATAIPAAIEQYAAAFRKLIANLFTDPEFQAATGN